MPASTMPANSATSAVADYQIASKWRWFVALGIVLILLGVAAWLDVVSVTLATTIVVGAILLAGGVLQIIHALMTRGWRGFVFGLLSGLLYAAGGLLIMREPVHGAVVLTLILAALIVAGGIVRVVLALGHRALRAWPLILVSGVASVVVGCLLYANLPWSGLWVLGTLIAIELLVQGGGWLSFGIALRFVGRSAAA
jgi:uncharacterized membrane protein HdeD (DUF308 family)